MAESLVQCGGKKLTGLCAKSFLIIGEKATKIGAWLTKLSPKQFSLSIYVMSVISNVSNLTR